MLRIEAGDPSHPRIVVGAVHGLRGRHMYRSTTSTERRACAMCTCVVGSWHNRKCCQPTHHRALCQLIPAGIVALHFDCRLPMASSPPSPNCETHPPSRELIHICMSSHHMPILRSNPAESAIAKSLLLNSEGAVHSTRRRIIPGTRAHDRCRYELGPGRAVLLQPSPGQYCISRSMSPS